MNILLSIDTKQEIDSIAQRLLEFIDLLHLQELYLDIFHSYEPPTITKRHMANIESDIRRSERHEQIRALRTIETSIEEAINSTAGLDCLVNAYLEEGGFVRKMQEFVKRKAYDLVVLVPAKRDSLEKFFRKNKVNDLIDTMKEPILVLPKKLETSNEAWDVVGLVSDDESLQTILSSNIYQNTKDDRKSLIHFGQDHLDNQNVQSMDTSSSDYFRDNHSNTIYTLHHTHKGSKMPFGSKSFTKALVDKGNVNLLVL